MDSYAQFLRLLAEVGDAMVQVANHCRGRPEVSNASRGCDVRTYKGGDEGPLVAFEAYVDTETFDGPSVTWWVALNTRGISWKIEASIRRNDKNGQTVLANLGEANIDSLQKLEICVKDICSSLEESAARFDFKTETLSMNI
jgi:hypothetical protein